MPSGVLFDLAGVLHAGEQAYPGAVKAVSQLRAAGIPMRFVTNTSRSTRASIVARLQGMGFHITSEEVFTAPLAAKAYCRSRGFHPYLLIHDELRPDFSDLTGEKPDAVLVADAAEGFSYQNMNRAFRLLMDGARLIAVAKNRYFRDGAVLSLDAGPFVTALEYASGTTAQLIGKPAVDFFAAAVADMGLEAAEVAMIGDDVEADVGGAINAGLQGILVRTGKFRPGDEQRMPRGAQVAADVSEALGVLALDLA